MRGSGSVFLGFRAHHGIFFFGASALADDDADENPDMPDGSWLFWMEEATEEWIPSQRRRKLVGKAGKNF